MKEEAKAAEEAAKANGSNDTKKEIDYMAIVNGHVGGPINWYDDAGHHSLDKLKDDTPHMVRKWYQPVLEYCVRFHIYLHPYYLFCKDGDNYRGFTVGDSPMDDLPMMFDQNLQAWGSLLHSALTMDKVIPDSCKCLKSTLDFYQDGKGYKSHLRHYKHYPSK